MGPLLFTVYLNDLPLHLENIILHMYADDTTAYFSSHQIETLEDVFSQDLINIAKWFSYNKLVLNVKKTSSMLISRHQKRRFVDRDIALLKFNDHIISSVTSDHFLGVIIDRSLIMDEHVNYLYNKLLKLLGLLWRIRNNLDLKSKLLFYNSYVQPCIDYCCTVWGTCSKVHLDRLTRLQTRIGRLFLNNYDSSKGYVQ